MTNALDTLERRATRGQHRGADDVFARAVSVPRNRPSSDRPRRVAAVLAVAVVIALVAAAVLALRADGPTGQGPTDEVPAPGIQTGPTGVPVEPPLFGSTTGTTLVIGGGLGEAVALDLDTGLAQRRAGVQPTSNSNSNFPDIGVVGDQLVFVNDQGLWKAPTDGSAPATLLTATPNGREIGNNDIFRTHPSGDTGRFWLVSGPIADAPDREFLAQEYDLSGATTSPSISLGRTELFVDGATSEDVLVGGAGVDERTIEVRDRTSGDVVRTVSDVIDTGGDLVVWHDRNEQGLHILDTSTGEDRTVDLPNRVDIDAGGELSPDHEQLAMVFQSGQGQVLGAVDLTSGVFTVPESPMYSGGWTRPVWSPDGQWLFGAVGNPDRASFVGYRIGADQGSAITVPGLSAWSVLAVASSPSNGDSEPCEGDVTVDAPCRLPVYAGAAPVDEGVTGDDAPTTTLVPDDDSPINPGAINILVANGSGREDAGGEVRGLLTSLGYLVFPPIDTTAGAQETPLDTVYFVEEPNTRPQARQVAHELGLSEAAVAPYPGPDAAHADIALAQVLVVLGSAPGQLATRVAGDSSEVRVEASPVDGLADRQQITVSGTGYRDGQGVMVIQCSAEHRLANRWCDNATNLGWSTPGGEFTEAFTVRATLDTASGPVDCRANQCALYVGGVGQNTEPIAISIDFA